MTGHQPNRHAQPDDLNTGPAAAHDGGGAGGSVRGAMGRHAAAGGAQPLQAASGSGAAPTVQVQVLATTADQRIRWRPGDRLDQLFEAQCDRLRDAGQGSRLAVDAGDTVLTYDELDSRANQLARHLRARGARPGDRIALLFDQPEYSYIAMLAVLKVHAAYVPLDAGFPADRLSYIVADSGATLVLSLAALRGRLRDVPAPILYLDEDEGSISVQGSGRLSEADKGSAADQLAYIIYTSGSTGKPKGVAVEHASVCNFVRVAADVYGIRPTDRVYQGMTIAFDFSMEEIWVPWMVGATIVPKEGSTSLLGAELADFLQSRAVTALCCVPTLLATLEDDVPGLRFLLVSGESCPPDLMLRWSRPGRRFLNVYGPTEATVTATLAVVDPHRTPTLGTPLPTYTAVILDPENDATLPTGSMGEIGLAGIGLARGYVNRADLTRKAFIPDFLDLPNNPSGRIYRTGDLGQINADGEIVYHGRIDTQVKIRGYRIELAEVETVIRQIPGIDQAVVATHEPEPGVAELVAYYSRHGRTAGLDEQSMQQHLRRALPSYMVPVYFVELDAFPLLPSDKIDRKSLPAPGPRFSAGTSQSFVPAATEQEALLAQALTEALGGPEVSADSDFFADLGANSITMAKFCFLVRKQQELAPVSMKDTYLHPTIRALATATQAVSPDVPRAGAPATFPASVRVPATAGQYVLCGSLQALTFLAGALAAGFMLTAGFGFTSTAATVPDALLRSALFGAVAFIGMCLLPIAAKWLIIGRWRVREIPVWTLAYFRFWLVKTLVRSSPIRLLVGSPLYTLYLRALGADIGPGTTIFSPEVPVCTDLLHVGAGTVIRKDASLNCYRVLDGMIQTGTVTIGEDAVVGEATVIDIGAAVGNHAQLGHASALYAGQCIPDGECWHGSPAQQADADYRGAEPAPCGTRRRVVYSIWMLLNRMLIVLPLGIGALTAFLPQLVSASHIDHASTAFYLQLLSLAVAVLAGLAIVPLAVITIGSRLLNLIVKSNTVYPLYGLRYTAYRTVSRLTNLKFFLKLTGDSSLIVYYLRLLGYKMPGLKQTGSNFGPAVKHESPFLSTIGSGTMVADGLSIMNAEISSSSFRLTPVSIGAGNFLGNNIVYPAAARIGDNCLIATKAMVPVSGPVLEGVGILGSPSFEIPRSVQRDAAFDNFKTGDAFRTGLRGKNRHNAVTILLFLLVRGGYIFAALLITSLALETSTLYGVFLAAGAVFVLFLFSLVYFTLIERASTGFRKLKPVFCSIYQPPFWRHERFWKLSSEAAALALLNGTPFKSVLWRMLGVRVGRRVFDDGCGIPEKTTVTIGDECTLNALSEIQCHSMEDGAFKLGETVIGARCTLGVKAFVHYGVHLGDGAVVEPDSFLMKGEDVPSGARFGGNPAAALAASTPVPQASMTNEAAER
jgi:non-ribosomal peptide synthetase-like protein